MLVNIVEVYFHILHITFSNLNFSINLHVSNNLWLIFVLRMCIYKKIYFKIIIRLIGNFIFKIYIK